MSVVSISTDGPSAGDTNASIISADEIVADEVYSLIDAVDGESIAEEFRIGIHNPKHDFENRVKVAVREGLDPSSSLAELADKIVVFPLRHVVSPLRIAPPRPPYLTVLSEFSVLRLPLEGVDGVEHLVVLVPINQHAEVTDTKLVAGMVLEPVEKVVREVADVLQLVDDSLRVLRFELLQRFDQCLRQNDLVSHRSALIVISAIVFVPVSQPSVPRGA